MTSACTGRYRPLVDLLAATEDQEPKLGPEGSTSASTVRSLTCWRRIGRVAR